jgi:CysZ protein
MKSKNNSFLTGISYLIDGFKLIFKPGLKRFMVIPALINLLLFIGFFLLFRHFMGEFNHWLENFLPSWLQWIGSIVWFIFFVGFIFFFIYFFITIANIITAPFSSFLSEKVEWYLTRKKTSPLTLWETIKDIPRIIKRQFAVLFYYLPRALLFLILFFIPWVQVIAPLPWLLFNAWYMVLQYIDYPADNHRISLQAVRSHLKEEKATALGLGLSILICTTIPILNFFIIPAAVAGATKWWVEKNNGIKKVLVLD